MFHLNRANKQILHKTLSIVACFFFCINSKRGFNFVSGESKFHFIVFPSEPPIFPKLHRGATEKSREQVDAREELHNDNK